MLTSKLELRAESRLPRIILLLELRRRWRLLSSGSVGCRPDARAKRFRISVRLTTPASLPAMLAPGSADAETEGVLLRGRKGGFDCGRDGKWEGAWETEGCESCGGIEVDCKDGDGESVTHILMRCGAHGQFWDLEAFSGEWMAHRWALVATSFATVCARVEYGLMWKTGKESLPSFMPRVERMTEMKWMQVLSSKGAELDLVRSCGMSIL